MIGGLSDEEAALRRARGEGNDYEIGTGRTYLDVVRASSGRSGGNDGSTALSASPADASLASRRLPERRPNRYLFADTWEGRRMIVVTGHLRLAPENVERARPHMRTVVEANRKEDGCLLFAFGEDVLDPGLIRIVERWQDWASLEAHDKAPHVVAWRAALKTIGVIDRNLWAHEGVNGRTI